MNKTEYKIPVNANYIAAMACFCEKSSGNKETLKCVYWEFLKDHKLRLTGTNGQLLFRMTLLIPEIPKELFGATALIPPMPKLKNPKKANETNLVVIVNTDEKDKKHKIISVKVCNRL